MIKTSRVLPLNEDDRIKERIRYQIELLKLFVVTLLATGGGVLALIPGTIDTGREVVFTGAGMIIVVLTLGLIYIKQGHIKKLMNGK